MDEAPFANTDPKNIERRGGCHKVIVALLHETSLWLAHNYTYIYIIIYNII